MAVVYRVGWPDQRVIQGTLKDIADKVRAAKITLQALIIVGEAVNPEISGGAASHLYASDYTHRYRRGQETVSGTRANGMMDAPSRDPVCRPARSFRDRS